MPLFLHPSHGMWGQKTPRSACRVSKFRFLLPLLFLGNLRQIILYPEASSEHRENESSPIG